jgi:Tetratricopeptide repeat
MQNLAYTYFPQERNAEAENCSGKDSKLVDERWVNDHASVLLALGNLANTLLAEGKSGEAEPLQREALEGRRRVLGPNHPETQFAMANPGYVVAAQKRYGEAVMTRVSTSCCPD